MPKITSTVTERKQKSIFFSYHRDGYKQCDIQIANEAAEYISNLYNTTDKSYSFIYFGEIDILGHNSTWCSAKYNDGMVVVDAQVNLM